MTGGRTPRINAFIQARMTSARFPGKVLAPLCNEPLIAHVVRAVERALPRGAIVVVTSDDASDDPLATYVETLGVACFRGPLDDVFARFRHALEKHPCDWVLRVSADSPLLAADVLESVLAGAADDVDVVTTVAPRTFPRGQNAELIRANTLRSVDEAELSRDDREHVTPYFYRHADRYAIRNVDSGRHGADEPSLAVDTVEDLHRLEALLASRAVGT